jgi:hypothetical protein
MALHVYESEEGEIITIACRKPDGGFSDISWGIEGDSKIEIKKDNVIILTLDGTTDFLFSGNNLIWSPTLAQLATLAPEILYDCYVHIINSGTPRTKILNFTLKILNN